MKIGEYIRTKYGRIGKIIGIGREIVFKPITYKEKLEDVKTNEVCVMVDTNYNFADENDSYLIEDIIKSSPNIIDLIEVGDYVNGKKVINKWEEPDWYGYFIKLDGEDTIPTIRKIESIVTKEQFKSME